MENWEVTQEEFDEFQELKKGLGEFTARTALKHIFNDKNEIGIDEYPHLKTNLGYYFDLIYIFEKVWEGRATISAIKRSN